MTAHRGIISEQRTSFEGWMTPQIKRIKSHRRDWLSGVDKYCLWNQSWYLFCWPNLTWEVRKTIFLSMSGVNLHWRNLREVLVWRSCKIPVNEGDRDRGAVKRSLQRDSKSGILETFWSNRTKSLPIIIQSENRSRRRVTHKWTSFDRRLGKLWWSMINRRNV